MKIRSYFIYSLIMLSISSGFSQELTSKWKGQLAFGVNNPSSSGFVAPFESKFVNGPTVNIGIQHMFKSQLGAKIDYGFSRISQKEETPEFKVNYSRVDLQVVYDVTPHLKFLSKDWLVVTHAGPGYTFIKPLDQYTNNTTSFFNAMGGAEFHYIIAERYSIFLDASYIYAFSSDFNPVSVGFGSFNGSLLTLTVGVSVSISGCITCY